MEDFDKYVKIVILSTLEKPRTLVEISTAWFNNKGRLYQPSIIAEIEKAVKNKLLIKNKQFYEPNMSKLVPLLLADLRVGELKKIMSTYSRKLTYFYVEMGDYTRKTYLNFEVIKQFTGLDYRRAAELDLKMLIQLPHFLRYVEYLDRSIFCMTIQVMNLKGYIEIIEKLEIQNYHILKEKKLVDDFIYSFEWFSKISEKTQNKDLAFFNKNTKIIKELGN